MESFLKNITKQPLKVLDQNIELNKYIPISISSKNTELTFNVSSSKEWEKYIDSYLAKHNAKVAYGGYLETRNIYNRSAYFSNENQRNIHLGMDFWCKANTNILSVLNGKIHSFKNNKNHGDYGPTIIIEHQIKGTIFYSLYGHLSEQSIQNINVGDVVKRGEVIAKLGDSSINGDYAPHLHFQLILNMEDYVGDYPGVSSEETLNFYKKNCPNPNLLLKLSNEI